MQLDSDDSNHIPGGWKAYKRLLTYVWPFALAFGVSILGFLVYAMTQAAFAGLMEFIPVAFGETASPEKTSFIQRLSFGQLNELNEDSLRIMLPLMVIGIILVRGIGSYLGNYYMTYVAQHVVNRLRQDLFNHMLVLPGAFYARSTTGQLISLITYNVEQVTGAATDATKILFREGLTVLVLFVYIFYLNWKLSLIFLIAGPLIGWVVAYASKLFRKYSRRIQNTMGGVSHVTSESVKGFQEVKAFGGVDYEQGRFEKASEENLKQRLKLSRVKEISTPVIQFILFSAIALLFWFGLHPDFRGDMDTGRFLAYITAASLIAKPLRQLSAINSKIQRGIAAAQSIFGVMNLDAEQDTGSHRVDRLQGRIEFKNLSFAYETEADPVLQDINLAVEPGQTLALVGHSGSGKTTLVRLLPRFLTGYQGEILLDGRPLEEYCLQNLRGQMALVSQQVVLFEDSVAGNIAYGELAGTSDEAIRKAATAAHAMEFIEQLPEGMATQIGEDGVMLSGGQRQRLALARAILKDSPILILDEATSALDTESERYIQEALETVMQNRTTVVIAHRLSTVENADKIAVLSQGRIVETGTHAELLAKEGAYANLYRMQFSESQS